MSEKSTVCLLMMVRDEAATIERCLLSVREHIDHWLIADTGSSDGTIDKAVRMLDGIPGEVISLPMTDFSTVRNSLRDQSRGRADYVLWLDADETLEAQSGRIGLDPEVPGYAVEVHTSRGCFLQSRLVSDEVEYSFSGSVAESLTGPAPFPYLDGLLIRHHEDGSRWRDAAKNQRDILQLKADLLADPQNPDRLVALADSFEARGEQLEALHCYQKSAGLSGDSHQQWYALYQAARMMDELGFDSQKVVEAYHAAYELEPGKIEPLVRIARCCRRAGQLQVAIDVSLAALETQQVDRAYFHEPDAWTQQRYLEYLRTSLALNCYTQVIDASEHLMSLGEMPLKALKQVAALRDEALQARSERPESERKPGDNPPAARQQRPAAVRPAYEPSEVPAATARREKRKLCIGMCTFDDYDGVYFSVQAIRMYHPEVLDQVEILVVDNNPTGPAASPLKALDGQISNYRYVPQTEIVGTASRDYIFREANADFVLVMDCHVFIVPGALKQLIDYIDSNPDSNDLLQGPLVYDDLTSVSTHFAPGWRKGMWGTWDTDPRGKDPQAEPFDIPMLGLGLFGCRREAWASFNPRFRGFGAEEGYIHEKMRQAGGRTLCLPFLRWMHRFNRPLGVPYPIDWASRVRNYLIGWHELGLESGSIEEHFAEILGAEASRRIVQRVEQEIQGPLFEFDDIYFYQGRGSQDLNDDTLSGWLEQLCISDRLIRNTPVDDVQDTEGQRVLGYRAMIEKTAKSGRQNLLIIEQPGVLANDPAGPVTARARQLFAGESPLVMVMADGADSPVEKLTVAVAIHQRAFDQLLSELPSDPAHLKDWLLAHGSLEQYLQSHIET